MNAPSDPWQRALVPFQGPIDSKLGIVPNDTAFTFWSVIISRFPAYCGDTSRLRAARRSGSGNQRSGIPSASTGLRKNYRLHVQGNPDDVMPRPTWDRPEDRTQRPTFRAIPWRVVLWLISTMP
jgi:hypothetical protein